MRSRVQKLTICFFCCLCLFLYPSELGWTHGYSLVFLFSYISYCMLGTAYHISFCSMISVDLIRRCDIKDLEYCQHNQFVREMTIG
ncbi:hypothetical protein BDV59DRAFT_38684 [Aspergillus ambiguus]|uniref:uncharacterized protein n=1 Tax=Aspergillus ambiguus TaxID=176160 RepID=UPI003CCD0F9D